MTIPIYEWMLKEGIKLYAKTISGEKKVTLKASTTNLVEVRVVTRLGAVPIKGVKLTVGGEDFGSSTDKGEYKGTDGKTRHKAIDGVAVDITGSYKNDAEKLREEKVSIKLTEIDSAEKTLKAQAKYEVSKIRNAPGETDDVDFKREYDAAADVAWKDEDGARVLVVTIKLCTFSLSVPFVNQRASNDTVTTRPGLAAGKDPETAAHDVKGPATDGKFPGGTLCYPTSVTMLLQYWGQQKTRAEVLQEFYDQWAESQFKGRRDKQPTTTVATTAPENPPEGKHWLDTSTDTGAGYKMKVAAYKIAWEILEGTSYAPKYTQNTAPSSPKKDEIWKDTSTDPAVFKKAVRMFDKWNDISEADWRVIDDIDKIWKVGWRATALLEGLKPTGCTSSDKPIQSATFLPLTKPAASDSALPTDVLAKYKEWLGKGWPFIVSTTATGGHIMVVRGAVMNEANELEWLIVNDPYGNLEGAGASYQSDEKNATSGAGADKGKNAYYRNETLGTDGKLRIKGDGRGFPRIEKAMTTAEIAKKLVSGA